MRFIKQFAIGWAVLLGLGCTIAFGQPNNPNGGMMPPPPHMNGMKPGMGPMGPNNKGPQKHHRGEEFRKVWERLQKEKPEEVARLEKLKSTNREEYFRELRKLFPQQVRVPNQTMKLDQQCWELGRQYKIARTEEERQAIRKELEEMVEKSFEAMVQEAKDRLETLEKKLQDMEKNKEKINKQRLEMFMRGFWKPQRPDEGGNKPEGGMPPPPPPQPPAAPQEGEAGN
ncbi:MAG: hypothetical protein IKZ46_01710 [Victivallales bacterium]|nr:hypothetical protein [Victivallales bacterium]